MKFLDAYILARTKRRTRRIRTAMIVVVSSLLFALLFGGAFVIQGILNAGQQVSETGFNSRYLVSFGSTGGGLDIGGLYASVQDELDDELRDRGIAVDDAVRQDPGSSYGAEHHRRFAEILAEHSMSLTQEIEERVSKTEGVVAMYRFRVLPLSNYVTEQPSPDTDLLIEELREQQESGPAGDLQNMGQAGGSELEFAKVEKDMLRTQLYAGQTFDWEPGEAYPIIVSHSYLEKLADRPLVNLSAAERNAGYRELMEEYAGQVLTYCFRNQAAQAQLRDVIRHNYIASKDDSTQPIEVNVCEGFDQSLLEDSGLLIEMDGTDEPLFPQPEPDPPITRQMEFKIVGFTPASTSGTTNIIAQTLFAISMFPADPYPAIVPSEVVAQEPLLAANEEGRLFDTGVRMYADFATREHQKAFIESEGCAGDECAEPDNLSIHSFGNLGVVLEGILGTAKKVLLLLSSVAIAIAALLMMFAMSKVIADSSKEIAVFRSLGARRRDIAQIYYTYGAMLAFGALVLAVVLALIGATVLTYMYGEGVVQELVYVSGAYSFDVSVSFIGLNWFWIAGITGALMLAACIGVTVPVLANLRRKLINILREE